MTEKKLKMKKITVRDLPKITNYLTKTGLKEDLIDIMAPKEEELTVTWAQIREEAGLSLEELNELQSNTRGDIMLALSTTDKLSHLVPKRDTYQEMLIKIINLAFNILDVEANYNATIELVAYLYETTTDEIEDMSLAEMKQLTEDITANADFLS